MTKVQKCASLSERTVQKVAAENITLKKRPVRGKTSRKATTAVKKSHWSDGVDPRVVKAVKSLHIPQVWRRIEVISPTEVIIHNLVR